jgi:hypothetical protein
MSFIKYTHQEVRAIIASLEEIPEKERNEFEDSVLEKSYEILKLQKQAKVKPTPELITNENGSLTIALGDEMSEPVSYKGIARLGNYFAVTEYWTGVFPPNQILKFFPIKRNEIGEPELTTTTKR